MVIVIDYKVNVSLAVPVVYYSFTTFLPQKYRYTVYQIAIRVTLVYDAKNTDLNFFFCRKFAETGSEERAKLQVCHTLTRLILNKLLVFLLQNYSKLKETSRQQKKEKATEGKKNWALEFRF